MRADSDIGIDGGVDFAEARSWAGNRLVTERRISLRSVAKLRAIAEGYKRP